MRRTARKWIYYVLIASMIISLIGPVAASAAEPIQLTIDNLYTVKDGDPADPTTDDSKVPRVTTNGITMTLTVGGLDLAEYNNIFFEVWNVTTNTKTEDKTNKGVVNPDNKKEITFSGISLKEGLNRITPRYGDAAYKPAWINFSPVVSITELKYQSEDFVDGGIYPKKPPYTNLTIEGKATNADQVQATVNGTVYGPSMFSKGIFSFITNTGRSNGLSFVPGDNEITFTAKNGTATNFLNRSFVYDNGAAFAFSSTVTDPTTTTDKKMTQLQIPTITSTDQKAQLSTKLKVARSGGVVQYTYGEVYIYGNYNDYHIKWNLDASGNPIAPIEEIGTWPSAAPHTITPIITRLDAESDDLSVIYKLDFELPINMSFKKQQLQYTFGGRGGSELTTHWFYFIDPSVPYIDHVDQSFGTSSIRLSELGDNQINELPATLDVYATANTDSIKVVIGTTEITDITGPDPIVDGSVTYNKFTVKLDRLNDGPATMTVTPYLAGVEKALGAKPYKMKISSVPYVVLNDIYSGKVYKSPYDISSCSGLAAPCISGRFINLPVAEYPNVEFSVNGTVVALTTDAATGTFNVSLGSVPEILKDGKKSLKFIMKINNQTVSQYNIDIYVLSDDVPVVSTFVPDEGTDTTTQKFVSKGDNKYVTNQSSVSFKGVILSQSSSPAATITYKGPKGTSGTLAITNPVRENVSDGYSTSFTTDKLNLDYGDYYFDLKITTTNGSTVTRSVTITREALAYQVIQPILINGQAIINQNFQTIIMDAEGADSVEFGKELANRSGSRFTYEAKGLKQGANTIKFTINRSAAKTTGTITLYNLNTPVEGAQYKDTLQTSMKVFNGDLELKFPKDTKLMRNDYAKPLLTINRKLLFGIADIDDGRVDKTNDGTSGSYYLNDTLETIHFKAASKLYWVDAGVVADPGNDVTKLDEALNGAGTTPMPPSGIPFYARENYYNDLIIPNKAGSITLKFDSSIKDDAWKYVSIFQYGVFDDKDGNLNKGEGKWKPLGGVVDTKNNTITAPISSFGYFRVMYLNDSFSDVTGHTWARDNLDILFARGIMKAKDAPNNFLPNDDISRGEFVSMLVDIFDIPLRNPDTENRNSDYQGTFVDVVKTRPLPSSNGLYDYLHIEAGARAGIVRGSAEGYFNPGFSITKQDAATMIARADDLKLNSDIDKSTAALQKLFTDGGTGDPYARPSIEAVVKAGYMDGVDNDLLPGQKKTTQRFEPSDNLTRAEASSIAIKIMKKLKKIPK